MNLRRKHLITAAAIGVLACSGAAYAATGRHAGPQGDGTSITPVGFRVTPAGRQVTLGLLPLASALSPDGSRLLVTNDGQGVQSLQVVDTDTGAVTQTLEYRQPEALFAGVAWSPDGTRAYASAGGNNKIRVYDVAGGRLTEGPPLKLPTTNPDGVKINMFPAGLAVSADGKKLYVADQQADAMSVIDVATGSVATTAVGHNPYGVALSGDGRTAYVTDQGENTVSVVDVSGDRPKTTGTITVGTHPNSAVPSGSRLYVTASDSDEVDVIDTTTNRLARRIDLRPYRGAQAGSNPVAVAPSPDGRLLYVANSGNNDVAVVDLRRGRVTGMIPTGWYPTSVRLRGDRLLVVNAKGLGAGPNTGPGQPDPTHPGTADKYIGSMIKGTLSIIDRPADRRNLARWSRQVVRNNGFDERDRVRAADGGAHVIPLHPGDRTPIRHVIYVVRENRTYDQEFGSLGKGDGDPSINLFGDESAPNSRAIARRFVTLDDFYADAEVSAQGWNWSVAGNSNPYVEATWPANYSGRNHPYDYEGGNQATAPGRDYRDSYIWDKLADKGISFRNYGFYTDSDGVADPIDPVLPAHTDSRYAGYDLSKQDHCDDRGVGRMCEWLREFGEYVRNGNLPTFEFVRLPNDHTAGTKAGSPTPRAYVADNDYALGQLVDAVSHSTYWKETAIFVVEDDAQNGPDHIDAHRTVAMVASPYTQTGRVDSTFYSTVSMLRTMELLVGVGPMTQFDAYATPMVRSFTNRPDFTPFTAQLPSQPFDEKNPKNAPMADISARQRLGKEDQIDERTFNQAIWKSVKGARSQMPEPRHLLPVLPDRDDD